MNVFDTIRTEIENNLTEFVGKIQNGKLEEEAQRAVTRVFKRHARQRKPVVLEDSGIQLVGCVLGFDIGKIFIKKFNTAFNSESVQRLFVARVPNGIPLGFVNGCQIWISGTRIYGSPAQGPDVNVEITKAEPGTVLFVAKQRAQVLGIITEFGLVVD